MSVKPPNEHCNEPEKYTEAMPTEADSMLRSDAKCYKKPQVRWGRGNRIKGFDECPS